MSRKEIIPGFKQTSVKVWRERGGGPSEGASRQGDCNTHGDAVLLGAIRVTRETTRSAPTRSARNTGSGEHLSHALPSPSPGFKPAAAAAMTNAKS